MKKDMKKKIKIGYLGPPGSFSEEAVLSIFGEIQDLFPFSSFELMKSLEKGKIQKAVLPVENSIDGSVNWVIDWLLKNNSSFLIEGETVLSIRHSLIGRGRIPDIKTVYSHPQALAQCRRFLNELGVETKDTDSTSEAVKLVAARNDPKIAALGSKRAAGIFGLPIIKENVCDNQNNKTRFIVLGKEQKRKSGKDKTSFIFGTKDKPGALFHVLEVFDVFGINMTMIISRPSKRELGEYVFFVDLEGHREDEKLKTAFKKITKRASFLKVLGSFPRAR